MLWVSINSRTHRGVQRDVQVLSYVNVPIHHMLNLHGKIGIWKPCGLFPKWHWWNCRARNEFLNPYLWMVVLTIFTWKCIIGGLFPTSVYILPSKQIYFPKIFTLLKERGVLNILNKPDGICVALCIPCDEIWFESNVAKESCSWMLFIHFFMFLMKKSTKHACDIWIT